MILCDYHIHTPRCGDSEGDYEEYIEEALRKNLSEIGFSGHSPQYFLSKELRKRESAIPEEELELYIHEVETLQAKYRQSITIRIGLEVDFIPGKEDDLLPIIQIHSWDYLLLSVHYLDGWAFDHPKYISRYQEENINEIYRRYYRTLKAGVETGFFDIVAHFDLPKKFGFVPTEPIEEEEEVLQACQKKDMVLEVNTAGFYKPIGEAYPSFPILQKAQSIGLKICLGSDAHKPLSVGQSFDQALNMIRKAGFQSLTAFKKREKIPYPIP